MTSMQASDGMSSDQKINISAFENYLNDGEVSKVVVVNKKTAQVTLTGPFSGKVLFIGSWMSFSS